MQRKGKLAWPGDTYEREADQVADQALRMPEQGTATPGQTIGDQIQRFTPNPEDELQRQSIEEEHCQRPGETIQTKEEAGETPSVSSDIESRIESMHGGGEPLGDGLRTHFESRFGADFSDVRVHTHAKAAESAAMLEANAYTTGRDIYFAAGKYAPSTLAGQRLLAHELTHTIQQKGEAGASRGMQLQISDSPINVQRDPTDGGAPASTPQPAPQTPSQKIIAALEKPDPIAGVGDYPEAFRIINGLSMADILIALNQLKKHGHFEVLNANLNYATGVDAPRIQVAFKAVELKGAVTAERFAADQKSLLSTLPSEQQADIARYLSPDWIPPLPPEGLSGASNTQLGAEYGLGLKGDAARVQAAEDEIEKREEKETGFGTALPGGGPAATAGAPGATNVSPDVAIKILENISKGEAPFRPELGKGGASWFVTEGTPYVGIDPVKNISLDVEISNMNEAIVFGEKELAAIFEQEMKASEAAAEAKFREHYGIDSDKPLSNRLLKSLKRFHEKFAESKMWDRVGEKVAKSPGKIGKVILQNSKFSKQGNGAFAVVSDPAKIKLKGGPTGVVEALDKAGIKAEPVVVEAAEALANKMKWAGRVRAVFRYGGKVLIVVAIAADLYKIYHAKDHVKAVIESVGGWAGATAAGAAFAAWWTPADVAGPWAWAAHGVGTLISGGIGYWIGSNITRTIYELVVED